MEDRLDHPDIHPMVHPPLVALAFIGLAYLLERVVPLPLPVPPVVRYAGLAMSLAGLLLGIGAFAEFREAHTTLNPHGSVKQLVTSGIYRLSRNPIYLGFLLMIAGLPLNTGSYWGIGVAPLYLAAMNRLVIEREEAYLETKFGERYSRYAARVRRWL